MRGQIGVFVGIFTLLIVNPYEAENGAGVGGFAPPNSKDLPQQFYLSNQGDLLSGIDVFLVRFPKNTGQAGVDVTGMRLDLEIQLRSLGIPFLDATDIPYSGPETFDTIRSIRAQGKNAAFLEFFFFSEAFRSPHTGFMYVCKIEVLEPVLLARDPSRSFLSRVYESGTALDVGANPSLEEMRTFSLFLKQFCNDYLKANPRSK